MGWKIQKLWNELDASSSMQEMAEYESSIQVQVFCIRIMKMME